MSIALSDDRLAAFQRVSQLRAIVQRLEEMLMHAHRLVVTVEELTQVEGLVDYGEPGGLHKLFALDDRLDDEIRKRASVLAGELASVEAYPLQTAALAAGDLVSALDGSEMELAKQLRDPR